ncbi:hypothetical protein PMIN01_01226 [Paraphaeosphaeria minitans]|uniref:Uncharacterized protein n=1 Tax=Paraphaeosphaeria minitans TaxID=565426 RepID=A0A9P6GTR8_9PLEO|nr:hypothetical protein PMIN01_01226 [Paraphaeosphaeria minitans]
MYGYRSGKQPSSLPSDRGRHGVGACREGSGKTQAWEAHCHRREPGAPGPGNIRARMKGQEHLEKPKHTRGICGFTVSGEEGPYLGYAGPGARAAGMGTKRTPRPSRLPTSQRQMADGRVDVRLFPGSKVVVET